MSKVLHSITICGDDPAQRLDVEQTPGEHMIILRVQTGQVRAGMALTRDDAVSLMGYLARALSEDE